MLITITNAVLNNIILCFFTLLNIPLLREPEGVQHDNYSRKQQGRRW